MTALNNEEMCSHFAVIGAADGDHHLVQKLSNTFRRSGSTMQYIGWDRLGQKENSFVQNGVEYRFLQRGWGFSNIGLLLALPLWFFRLVYFSIFRLRADLIYVSELESALAISLIAPLRRIPFIYDIRDNFSLRHHWLKPFTGLINIFENWTMRKAEAIVVVDENRIVGPLEQFRDKITIIYNCPEDYFCPGSIEEHDRNRPYIILASGLLRENRGIHHLLEATKRIQNVKVIMAGRFVEEQLEKEARDHPRTSVLGWLPREKALELCCRVDLVFSMYDPIDELGRRAASNKWFDAMMAAKPILANSEVVRAEWIVNEGIGYICKYGDVDELVSTLEHIIQNPEEAAERGRCGRILYENEFNWPNMERRMVALFKKALFAPSSHST